MKQIEKKKDFFKNLLSKSVSYFKSEKPKFKPYSAVKFFAILFILIFVSHSSPWVDAASKTPTKPSYTYSIKYRAKHELINEVKFLMNNITPGTKIDPEYLINKCIKYDMDIVFVLAQGILESHLGTKGKASRTNSVWNVGTYDNGKILYTYKDPNESIEPYLKLLRSRYLNNKDIQHLIIDRGYINDQGKRFASALQYENGLRKLITRINMETNISFHQKILQLSDDQILAYFSPPNYSDNNNILANN